MNNLKYQWILYLIVFVILSTISIQIYWNYKNYRTNKQQLINDVQVSLDNAVNNYYANLAERSTIGFAINGMAPDDLANGSFHFDSIFNRFDLREHEHSKIDSLEIDIHDGVQVFQRLRGDTMMRTVRKRQFDTIIKPNRLMLRYDDLTYKDSLSLYNFRELTSQVIISMTQDTLNLKHIDSILKNELNRKKIGVVYTLVYEFPNVETQYLKAPKKANSETKENEKTPILSTVSKSSFLPSGSVLKIEFSNETKDILKRIMSGILISTLLVLSIISCLFYLLHIIKRQKQMAEVQNDLISNITHEFKTPIATIGVALESIKNFDVIEDKNKTKSYLDMSTQQLKKLNLMVEKLLETATLDSETLALNKETVDVVELLFNLVEKHKLSLENKSLTFSTEKDKIEASIDFFHFENAISNILDNAIKYGGDNISISINQENNDILTITVNDDGNSLTKGNKDKIFEKFYRIPTGNTHNVKGFGIGLYYTKSIIEKHNGIIYLDLSKDQTSFKISIPK